MIVAQVMSHSELDLEMEKFSRAAHEDRERERQERAAAVLREEKENARMAAYFTRCSTRAGRPAMAESGVGTLAAEATAEGVTPAPVSIPVEPAGPDVSEVELDPVLEAMLQDLEKSDNVKRLGMKRTTQLPPRAPSQSSKPASTPIAALAGPTIRVLRPPALAGGPRSTATLVAPVTSPVASQPAAFPVADVTSIKRVVDPQGAMRSLCRELAVHQDYGRIRDEYCSLAIQMNEDKRLAPAFRPQVVTNARRGDPVYMLIHRDRVVIDYHWCHATAMEMRPLEPRHAALLDLDHEFNFLQAWELACCRTKSKYRGAEALALTTMQQCQTLALRGPELAERAKGLESGYRESNGEFSSRRAVAMRRIREWTSRTAILRAQTRVYECLWQARELLGPDNIPQVPALVALMTGEPPKDRKTIRDKLVLLDKHVRVP